MYALHTHQWIINKDKALLSLKHWFSAILIITTESASIDKFN